MKSNRPQRQKAGYVAATSEAAPLANQFPDNREGLVMETRRMSWRGFAIAVVGALLLTAPGCRHVGISADATEERDEETVNTGYGVVPADQAAGAVSVISADDWGSIHAIQLEELVHGRAAGVQVLATPGGGFAIRIRGASTIYGSNDPLYVMDGMPVHVDPGRGIDWLNLADIARIDILKDASATAMYGVRGANGVVLITTRRGRPDADPPGKN